MKEYAGLIKEFALIALGIIFFVSLWNATGWAIGRASALARSRKRWKIYIRNLREQTYAGLKCEKAFKEKWAALSGDREAVRRCRRQLRAIAREVARRDRDWAKHPLNPHKKMPS